MTTLKKVSVTIAEGYTGHHHCGREVQPGDTIEVYPDQARFLEELGALAPEKTKKTKKTASDSEPELVEQSEAADSDEVTTED